MANWPVTLPQRPLKQGYNRLPIENVIRSNMSYGPPKQRKRVTHYLYNVSMQFWLDRDDYEILDNFYKDNAEIEFDWVDFGLGTEPAAKYIFLAPPSMSALSGIYFTVTLKLLMESYG